VIAIGLIFVLLAGLVPLGASVVTRSGESDAALGQQVAQSRGGRHEQAAPTAASSARARSASTEEKDDQGRTSAA
jgi:hypothetical protein